ncbi:hypothetical protein JXQ31_15690 [candidate division KSB1 bacterium]|nr:hypothetical protein [candidate division KSB1 bacterium]
MIVIQKDDIAGRGFTRFLFAALFEMTVATTALTTPRNASPLCDAYTRSSGDSYPWTGLGQGFPIPVFHDLSILSGQESRLHYNTRVWKLCAIRWYTMQILWTVRYLRVSAFIK